MESTEQPLDPEKIFLGHPLGQRAKKRAIATAKIDMQRRPTSEDFLGVEPVTQRLQLDERRTPKAFGAVS